MPHQCVRCNTFYPDASKELLEGCSKCGGKFFFYVKQEFIKKAEEFTENLTKQDKERIERDVTKIIGTEFEDDRPIVLDLENINIAGPGKFEIDLMHLFKGEPLVYKVENGKYVIDLASSFQLKKSK